VWTVWHREMLCFHSFSEFSQAFISVSITQERSSKDYTRENCFPFIYKNTARGRRGDYFFTSTIKRKVSLVTPIITSPACARSCSYNVYRIAVIAVESAVKYSFVLKGMQTRWKGQYKAELTLSPCLCINPLITARTAIVAFCSSFLLDGFILKSII